MDSIRTTKSNGAGSAKFDDERFSRFLNLHAQEPLLKLLKSIDSRARIEISTYVKRYLTRGEMDPLLTQRRQRAQRIIKALKGTIASLRKAAIQYRALADITVSEGKSIVHTGKAIWPRDLPPLQDVLEAEVIRLAALLGVAQGIYREKRFGVSGYHSWLILLQEFVAAWTKEELGEGRQLSPAEIALLLTAGKTALGWREDRTDTDAEPIEKAMRNFRSHPLNAAISGNLARSYAQDRCAATRARSLAQGNKNRPKP